MIFAIHANVFDLGTEHLSAVIQPLCESLGNALSNDYGGVMEHFWIDVDLAPGRSDRKRPSSFRFQKRVASNVFRLPGAREYNNVGHYSVTPDFFELATVPKQQTGCYLMRLVYESTVVLKKKADRLGNFDVARFRSDFAATLRDLGCAPLVEDPNPGIPTHSTASERATEPSLSGPSAKS